MEKLLTDYNEYPGQVPMDLVLFRDAIEHGKLEFSNFYFKQLKQNYNYSVSYCESDQTAKRQYVCDGYWW